MILRASQNDITLMPSCNKAAASTESILEGTDEGKTLETNQYALSLGDNGVGFYLWEGKEISANKAYLTLASGAKAFVLDFYDEPTGIKNHQPSTTPSTSSGQANHQPSLYNLNGIRVNGNYKGIVIKNGKKFYQR